jgi:hypothetical protein
VDASVSRLDSIVDLNALPFGVREQLYLRLVPDELLRQLAIDRATLRGPGGERLVRITAHDATAWARVEVRAGANDRDPVLLVDIGMSAFAVPELAFVQIGNPSAPRFGIDRDEDGQDTLLGTNGRNTREEARALAAGLAPGQVRGGLRMLGRVLECMDAFCALLGRELYLVEPLFYHSAILYERHGCDYFIGRERMEEIHDDFQSGGALGQRLDDSSPFRRPEFGNSVRGRSWAIHDGVLGEPWNHMKMYRVPGRPAGVSTFPGARY